MAYTKQTWVDGTTPIDAEHLNHMEDGIAKAMTYKKVYVFNDNGVKKLSLSNSALDPASFGEMYQEVFLHNTQYVVDGGLVFIETVVHFYSQIGGADANTVRTLTRTFKENGNNELVLQE